VRKRSFSIVFREREVGASWGLGGSIYGRWGVWDYMDIGLSLNLGGYEIICRDYFMHSGFFQPPIDTEIQTSIQPL
jgi:hypothetical protein